MIINAIYQNAVDRIAIQTPRENISYGSLFEQVGRVYYWLIDHNVKVLVLESDNVPEWI